VLIHEAGVSDADAGATARMKRPELLTTLLGGVPAVDRIASGDIAVDGDASLYEALTGLIEPVTANFPIVTP
jgi:alkyl sulfatase BDS1-like metallo-beta-lactamase superfamily hydrolase